MKCPWSLEPKAAFDVAFFPPHITVYRDFGDAETGELGYLAQSRRLAEFLRAEEKHPLGHSFREGFEAIVVVGDVAPDEPLARRDGILTGALRHLEMRETRIATV